jgi:membrane protease subunit HflC
MQTERQREAAEIRAQGAEQAQRTRARADRDVTVLLAEANSKSEQIRGEGDGTRNRIFAEAYGRDVEFFNFYRSMQAYENGLKTGETRLLLAPDSDFFRFFNDVRGGVPAAAAPAAPAGSAPAPSSSAPAPTLGGGGTAAAR